MRSELHIGRMILQEDQRLDIVGPCAAQSRDQVMECAQEVKAYGISAFRACVFKPRTAPAPFEGVGAEGYEWLAEATKLGLTAATELRHGDDVRRFAERLLAVNENANAIIWVGSRNTDHLNVRSIGQAVAEYPCLSVGHKNPLHLKEDHNDWIGLIDHLRSGGVADEHVFLVHRGFAVNKYMPNPHGYKNIPEHEVAMHVAERTGLPIIMDLSHPAGRSDLVRTVAEETVDYGYRGFMIEAAPLRRIEEAITDKPQHVTIHEAVEIIRKDNASRKDVGLLQKFA